ncbi:MAG TPA: hypothetical protein VNK95_17700 [Caldilineaceae bacterium]|nr:hypothetical protein [Caldilineaceae bacterium]
MITLLQLVDSPVGPAVVLLLGAIVEVIVGRWVRRPGWLTGLALFFVALAAWLFLGLRAEPVVPVFSRPWQPPLQRGSNLLWVGDGWNWYISGLVLLLGGVGILLDLNRPQPAAPASGRWVQSSLAIHLGVLAAGLLFVGSGNVLTAMLTWVVLDLFTLVRGATRPENTGGGTHLLNSPQHQAKGLSLLGAMLLLIGLLPAGPTGPSQPLQGGQLPAETVGLMLLAALIRAGIYPFHLWLLPDHSRQVNVAERLLDHMVPVLCGLWLLGWTVELGGEYILLQPDILLLLILSLGGSAVAAWTAADQPNHTTFVLITSAGLAALSGALAFQQGPAGLIWPTTAFALGGALWLVGDQVWQAWGWQLPVSVGALALAGVPFTPGFLTQPSLARLLTAGPLYLLLFAAMAAAMGVQVAAMLRSWSDGQRNDRPMLRPGIILRLLAAVILLGFPLALVGFFPAQTAELANLSNAIPPMLGNPPNVVAEWPVWVAVSLPLVLGIGLVSLRPTLWALLGPWPERLSRLTRLQWLFRFSWWSVNQISESWGNVLRVVEGAGYMGWVVVAIVMGYLLVR